MTRDKKEFIEAILSWFNTPKVGNDEELDRKFLASAYDNITQPHWISVEDELPPKQAMRQQSKDVLVRTNTGRIKIEYYDYDNEVIKQWWKNYITHWTYLPLPPVLSNSENTGKDLKGGENG